MIVNDSCSHAEIVALEPEPDGSIFGRCVACGDSTFPIRDVAYAEFLTSPEGRHRCSLIWMLEDGLSYSEALAASLKEALVTDLQPGSRWRHWKGGTYVLVTAGFEEATGLAVGAYKSDETGVTWVRPLGNFLGMVKDAGAPSPSVPRFTAIEESAP